MTRQELTYSRPTNFSLWIREKCRSSSTGFVNNNIDHIFFDYKEVDRRLALIEEKHNNSPFLADGEKHFFPLINKFFEFFGKEINIKYQGFYIFVFPDDGMGEIETLSFPMRIYPLTQIINDDFSSPLFVNTENELIERINNFRFTKKGGAETHQSQDFGNTARQTRLSAPKIDS
ncbi:MAG: hypothetical protein FJZ16_02505 [Candidatus Omnitrophica bacterium]|nr:hypothetical protein [Candidatus Omnitrophota bacterium]